MLLRSWAPVILALVHLVKADDMDGFSNLSSCGQNCVNNMRTSTGCVPVTNECLCSNQDFVFGITDCANSACTSDEAQSALEWSQSWCASVTASTSTAAATSTAEEATSTSDAATTSESTAPATVAAQTTTSDSATTPPASTATEVSGTTSTDAAAATTLATSTASSAAGTGASTQGTSDASATSGTPSSSTSASASSSPSSSSDDTTSSGLSAGAKAGIVVGAAGAAILVVAAVLCLSRKRKKPTPRGTMKISEPLPGSGRIGDDVWERYHSPPPFSPMYSSKQQMPPGTATSHYSELSRHARPYEEMVPRTTPTRMV